jgi:hypothetical protein
MWAPKCQCQWWPGQNLDAYYDVSADQLTFMQAYCHCIVDTYHWHHSPHATNCKFDGVPTATITTIMDTATGYHFTTDSDSTGTGPRQHLSLDVFSYLCLPPQQCFRYCHLFLLS